MMKVNIINKRYDKNTINTHCGLELSNAYTKAYLVDVQFFFYHTA